MGTPRISRIVRCALVACAFGVTQPIATEEKDKELPYRQILVEADIIELNSLPGGEDLEYRSRMYVLKDAACDERERLGCRQKYFVAIGEYGEDPHRRVMLVGEFEGLRLVRWLVERRDGYPVLQVEMLRHPEADPTIAEHVATIELALGVDRIGYLTTWRAE